MTTENSDDVVRCLSRKRVRDEEESKKHMTIIINMIVSFIAMLIVAWYNETFLEKEPWVDNDKDRKNYLNSLYNRSDVDCIENLRVSKRAFKRLCTILQEKGGLKRTRNVPIEESVAMFLHMLAHNVKIRPIHLRFSRSKETVNRQFNRVLHAIMQLSSEYLRLHSCALSGSERNKWKWFQNCIGALDGTHIPVTVSTEDRPRYRNRKGDITTNVLGVCTPDMKFTYVLPGWEESTSDARVLRDALRRDNSFQVPNDKFYLVDAGYANAQGFLAPYRRTRYHLNEWRGGNRPENYKELFNLRHSVARNVVERSFGLLKKRWSILRTASFFKIQTQIRIINACFVLHNFIRIEQLNDPALQAADLKFLASVDEEIARRSTLDNNSNNSTDRIGTIEVTEEWTTFRETLALQMFHDYQARRNANL